MFSRSCKKNNRTGTFPSKQITKQITRRFEAKAYFPLANIIKSQHQNANIKHLKFEITAGDGTRL